MPEKPEVQPDLLDASIVPYVVIFDLQRTT